jgi:hypothetical protein
LVLTVTATISSCDATGDRSYGLHLAGGDNAPAAGLDKIDVPVGAALTVATFPICATKSPVTITSVQLENPEGIEVVGWATRRNPPVASDPNEMEHFGTASQVYYSSGPVIRLCTDKNYSANFDITVRSTAPNGRFFKFRIKYRGGSLLVPFGVGLCQHTCPPRYTEPGAGH